MISTSTIVLESWAREVQWQSPKEIYSNYKFEFGYSRRKYYGIVDDLIDGCKVITSYYFVDENFS